MKKTIDEKKLIEIYKEASKYFYSNQNNANQRSIHWQSYFLEEVTLDNLINFRKGHINKFDGKLSVGLDDQNDNFTFKLYSEIINQTSESYILNNLLQKNIGNSDVLIKYKDVFVDYNKLIHIYWFWIIENKILKNIKINNICEIGGGFGSFSELFIKNYNTKTFLIDLPEANLISAYYLKELFPQKKFYLFDDYKKNEILSKLDFDENDIIILPPNCNIDKKIKIDFFINTRSMMEMNFDVIKSYFDFIHQYLSEDGYFLNINRYEKTSVGFPIRISEYPYDTNWKVIISEPSFNQNWVHCLLTQRSFKKNEINIFEELKNIKIIGKKFYGEKIVYNPKSMILRKKLRKILIMTFGSKFLNYIGNFLFKIGTKLKNTK
jgi:putative sugar O-methyltransferase